MKTASFTLLLLVNVIFQSSAFSQNKDSASIFADITTKETISLPSSFDFSKSLTIVQTSGIKSNKTDLNYTLRYPDTEAYMAMTISGFEGENPKTRPEILVDFEEDKLITFMQFANSKLAMIRNLSESKGGVTILNESLENLKETGKKKKILGYACSEFTFNNNNLEGTVWLTQTICHEFAQSFSTLGLHIKSEEHTMYSGYIMRLNASDVKTGEILSLIVKDINLESPYSIDSQNYVVTGVPSR